MFRRRNAGADGGVDTATTDETAPGTSDNPASRAVTPGKGRPTPKRSEAERRRRNPYVSGDKGDKKAATTQSKTRDRAERGRRYEAMKRGEDWALPVRDKGPVKALTRDYVDSHRRISEYYMYIAFALLVILLIPEKAIKTWIYPVVLALVVVMVLEGYSTSRAVRKLAAERCPSDSTRGVTMYAIMRTLQIRRLRMPSPRTKPGDKI
ncbi:MAG TPA: DUF3043 domain-containing protein [Streptosporangiaceae bacterium]